MVEVAAAQYYSRLRLDSPKMSSASSNCCPGCLQDVDILRLTNTHFEHLKAPSSIFSQLY
jgi:hypothetical protein